MGFMRRIHNVSGASSWVLPGGYSAIAEAASLVRASEERAFGGSPLVSSSSSSTVIEAILFVGVAPVWAGNAYASCSLTDQVFNLAMILFKGSANARSSNSVMASTLLQ
ncbi:hypothetical protein Osc7112_1040 [Oscillatoria nigro-viridis PCC 7112]|uniref:Uncharacterized protein n=1 Tax=Phormidium nigroviride PCC 7112 TaxID=179408 RepID=K9VBV4_9CYAN|nr:hypothetical protein Osc7112_1040 [Oscillatoria nigro-viridis PCC 7112]